jgi:hypothetical protein
MVKLGAETDTEYISHEKRWSPYGTRFEKYYIEVLHPLYERNVSDLWKIIRNCLPLFALPFAFS